MKRRYQNAFEQLNTSEQLEETIIRTCMEAEPEMTPQLRRRPMRRLVPVLTAAAVGTAVMGVSAYAITTGIRKQADTYFTQNSANTELLSSTEETRIYDDYYQELGLSATSGDTTINLHGYISDDIHVYIFGNIVAPEDMVLDTEYPDHNQEYDFWNYIPEFDWSKKSTSSSCCWNGNLSFLPFDETVPNQREFVYMMTYSGGFEWEIVESLTFTDFRKVVVSENIGVAYDRELLISGTWTFPELNLTTTHEPISLIDEPVKLTWTYEETGAKGVCSVDDIRLSLFGIQFEETNDWASCQPSVCAIYMKDGTVYERMDENVDNILVDLSQVDCVQIGDQTFTIPEDAEFPSGSVTMPVQ